VEFNTLVSLFQNPKATFVVSLDNPPFSIAEGRVEINFFGFSAVDRNGKAVNPYAYGAIILKIVRTHLTWVNGELSSRVQEFLD
jgi:hypothetical protein